MKRALIFIANLYSVGVLALFSTVALLDHGHSIQVALMWVVICILPPFWTAAKLVSLPDIRATPQEPTDE